MTAGQQREEYHLPAVLSADAAKRESARSVLRSLKLAKEVIEELLPEGEIPHKAQVALDDLEILISRVMP